MSGMEVIFAPDCREAFERAGLDYPEREPEPGRLCRFPTNGRKDDAAGWLRIFPDQNGAAFGDWRSGAAFTWQRQKDGPPPNPAELAAIRARAEEARKAAEAEREQSYQEAAKKAAATWQAAEPATAHPYLERKGIAAHIARERGGWLVIPVFDQDGGIQSVQSVSPTGEKRFMPGGKMAGGRCWIGEPTDAGPLVLCEGYATGASIAEATGWPVACCFTAGNLRRVACDVREQFPRARLVIAGDDDRATEGNPGRTKALEAAKVVQGIAVFPSFDGPEGTDWNDYAAAHGLEAVRRAIADAVEPPPTLWPSDSGSIADYLDTPPPALHWFAHERLLANRAHLLTGMGGTSKTTVLYHLGIAAVTGRLPWGWQIERTGAALLLLAEDDAANVHRVIANHARHADLSPHERRLIAERLKVFPMAGQACRLLAAGPNGTLHETKEAAGLFALAKRIPELRFIALDPALALTEGDEMSPAHQRRLGELADRLALETGACVVLASHAAKATNQADELGSHTSRGSGAITDAVRGELALRTMTATEARKYGISDTAERKAHVQLTLTKSNAAPPAAFVPVWLKRGTGGLLSVAELAESETGTIGTRERKALDLLRELSAVEAPQLKDWREACDAAGLLTGRNEEARKKSMQRILRALMAAGEIEPGMRKGVYAPVAGGEE